MDERQIDELHNLLIDTIIKFINNNKITDLDQIYFSADDLQCSAKFGNRAPDTDSSLIGKTHDREKIFESFK